ncbi:hypothetical protein HOI04_02565, partial [archaeon]|nr:hypothetical protein [archaeon]
EGDFYLSDSGLGNCCSGECIGSGNNFGEGQPINGQELEGGMLLGLMAMILPFLLIFGLIFLGFYIYASLAYMKIADKTQTPNGWLAWIPIANLYLISRMAKSHWWPLLLLLTYPIMLISPALAFIPMIAMFILMVFVIIWTWKMFQAVGMRGWWSITPLIPFIGSIIFLVGLGIAAWGKKGPVGQVQPQITPQAVQEIPIE